MADPPANVAATTPTDEQKQRIAEYGPFAGASVSVDKMAKTVKVRIDDPLKGKDSVEITTDEANAAAWIFNDVIASLSTAAEKVKKSFSG